MNKELKKLFEEEFGNLGDFRSDDLGLLSLEAQRFSAILSFIETHTIAKKDIEEVIEYWETDGQSFTKGVLDDLQEKLL